MPKTDIENRIANDSNNDIESLSRDLSTGSLFRLIDALPIGLAVINPDGSALVCNQAIIKMLADGSRDKFSSILKKLLQGRETPRRPILSPSLPGGCDAPKTQEHCRCRDDGSTFWGRLTIIDLADGDGHLPLKAIVLEDISTRREAEEEKGEQERRYQALFDATFDGIAIHANGTVIEINSVFEEMFGYRKEEIVGRSVLEIIEPEYRKISLEKIRQSFQRPYEVIGRRKDGSLFDMEIVAKEQIFRGNRVRVAAFRDITAHKTIENALREANEMLEAERMSLREKNAALKEIMNQIDQEKEHLKSRMQGNIERVVLPLLDGLEQKATVHERNYFTLIRSSLLEIGSPFINTLEHQFGRLSPREVEICNMIKSGYRSKDIATILNTTVQTVLKQRKQIRRKLGITDQEINLTTYLQSLEKP